MTTPNPFYSTEAPPLQQGDVVAVPFARLQTESGLFPQQWASIDLVVDRLEFPTELPGAWVVGGYGWGMVLSHDCHLDKDFNKAVRRLRDKQQLSQDEAAKIAEQDSQLDRFVTVSPILPVSAFSDQAADAAEGRVVGLFHLPTDEDRDWDEHIVDLSYRVTVDRCFIEDRRFVLSEEARMRLRYAVARAETFRSSDIGFQLEEVMNKRIRDVRQDPENSIGVIVELWDGTLMRLVKQPAEPSDHGPQRTTAPATRT